ncbi:hypothetical protein ES703_83275 [subsurface metagenome]
MEAEVEGHGHPTDLRQGEVCLHELVAVKGQYGYLGPLLNTKVEQGMGQLIDAGVKLLIGQTGFSEYQRLLIGKLAAITGHHFPQKESPPQRFLYCLFIFYDRPPFHALAGDRYGQMYYTCGEIPCWR